MHKLIVTAIWKRPLCVLWIHLQNVFSHRLCRGVFYKCHSANGGPGSHKDGTLTHPGDYTQDPLSNNHWINDSKKKDHRIKTAFLSQIWIIKITFNATFDAMIVFSKSNQVTMRRYVIWRANCLDVVQCYILCIEGLGDLSFKIHSNRLWFLSYWNIRFNVFTYWHYKCKIHKWILIEII